MRPIRALCLSAAAFASVAVTAAETKWSYEGATGPDRWGRLDKSYAVCSTGTAQSPIDIEDTDPVLMHSIHTDYRVTPVSLVNTGHAVMLEVEPGSVFAIGNRTYGLQHVEIHTPSEHAVLGVHAPLELQFHHRDERGNVAVIAVLVEQGAENKAASEFWPSLPIEAGQRNRLPNVLVNPRDLMPANKGFYRYMGSLTTPPCTEGVNWYVLKKPIEMSAAQINAAKALMHGNARPLQARNHRMILDSEGAQ